MSAQHTPGRIAQAWEEAMIETINDDARVKSFTWLTICPQCLFGEVDGRMQYEPGRVGAALRRRAGMTPEQTYAAHVAAKTEVAA